MAVAEGSSAEGAGFDPVTSQRLSYPVTVRVHAAPVAPHVRVGETLHGERPPTVTVMKPTGGRCACRVRTRISRTRTREHTGGPRHPAAPEGADGPGAWWLRRAGCQ